MNTKDIVRLISVCLQSWWFYGIVGWLLIIAFYPIGVVIPRYAG